jgi:ABC-type lipoprotein export system ATPase subunit
MIRLKNVSKIYYNNGVIGTGFTKVSLEFHIGEFVAITGESGSGKSTLLNVISGLDTYEEGEMYINGEETSHYNIDDFEEYRRKYIANIFQSFNLVNSYTVRQNIELVLLIHGYSKKEINDSVNKIMKRVGLYEYRNKKVSKLSGGQKQRVAIARALAKDTPIIVADEPTGNLDSESSKQIIELLHEISKDKLVIIVTHNYEQVEKCATRVITMHDGKVVEDKHLKDYKESSVKQSVHKNMSINSKINIAFRNTFNIMHKFLLIFGVFIVVIFGILTNIGSTIKSQKTSLIDSIAYVFSLNDPSRIIIRNKDASIISDEDYEKISKINHVESIDKDDIRLDAKLAFCQTDDYLCLDTLFRDIDDFKYDLVSGRLPENDNEVVLVLTKDDYLYEYYAETLINTKVNIGSFSLSNLFSHNFNVVGVAYASDVTINLFYANKNVITYLQNLDIVDKSDGKITINNQDIDVDNTSVLFDSKVKPGEVYISEDLLDLCKNDKCVGDSIKLNVSNIYVNNSKEFNITNVVNKNNFSSLLNTEEYNFTSNRIIMNINDYMELNSTENYQVSVFVDDVDNVDYVLKELKDLNFNALAIKDSSDVDSSDFSKIMKFYRLVSSIILIIILYFVSSYIIFLVLKSRNTYFAIVRMLGGNIKLSRELLNIELFIISTISFIFIIIFCILVNCNIINSNFLTDFINYLKWYHYLFVYVIIIGMSQLISYKFSNRLFKDSAITTYNMEV